MSKVLQKVKRFALTELSLPENRAKKQNVVAICFDKQAKILSVSSNSFCKSSATQALIAKKVGSAARTYLHAEVNCLLRWRRFSAEPIYGLYVARMDKAGNLTNSKPCSICSAAIKEFNIKKVYFT